MKATSRRANVSVSYLEIYNEQVRDLLVPAPVQTDPDRPPPQPKALNLQNRLQGGVTVSRPELEEASQCSGGEKGPEGGR